MSELITQRIREYTDKEIILLDEVDSTNNYLKKNAHRLEANTCVIAKKQTAGRGRRGKSFLSNNENGLYLSVLLKLKSFDAGEITAAAAVAVARAIKRFSYKQPKIKWVNDVYIGTKKACGILCEALFDNGKPQYIIVGIGVNLIKPQNDFDEEIRDIATAVFENNDVDFDLFSATVINEFFSLIDKKGFLSEYKELSMLVGKKVIFSDFSSEKEGIVQEITDDFGILINVEGSSKIFKSGEITFANF